MVQPEHSSGPQFRADRPAEQEAVRTTIVGGRPPGSGQSLGPIPRGMELLVKKASVDPQFKALLLKRRADAADEIGLQLEPAEAMMLAAVPAVQLETIIAQTTVPNEHRRAFLGHAAAAMFAAIGLAVPGYLGCGGGVRPHDTSRTDEEDATTSTTSTTTTTGKTTPDPAGIRPDEVPITGVRPDKVPAPTGSRPDPPEPPGAAPRPDNIPLTKGSRPDVPP